MNSSALYAPIGETVELEGRLRADPSASHRSLRCESVAVFEDGKLSVRSKKISSPKLELELEDGSLVALDIGSLKETSVGPRSRVHALWKSAREQRVLIAPDQAIRPEQRVELRACEIAEHAKVRVRGVVSEHSALEAKVDGVFRGTAASRVSAIAVTHLAGGADPQRTMQSLVEHSVDWAPSLFESRSKLWLIMAAAGAAALLAYPLRNYNSVVWKADSVTTATALFAVAGAILAERARPIAMQFALDPKAHGARDVRVNDVVSVLFAVLTSTVVAWGLVIDLVTSSPSRSYTAIGILMSLASMLVMAAVIVARARSTHATLRRLLSPAKASEKSSGVIEGVIGDRTPIESELGPAAVVALTVEEVVAGSDPNITQHSLAKEQDFFLRTDDGEVSVDIEKVRWASTVHMKIPAYESGSNAVFHHKMIIPVGAKAIAWGRAVRGKFLANAIDNEQLLFVTAPNEEPRAVLRSLRRSMHIGLAIIAASLLGAILHALAVWPYLPSASAGG
jgi:hypothetical protein